MAPGSSRGIPGWRSFLRRGEFFRHKYSSLVPSRPSTDIMHGDLECRYTHPLVDGKTPTFLNLPWLRANRETEPAPYRVLTTDLKESDVVLGGRNLAKKSLELAVASAPAGSVILLNSGCVPDLTGENLESLLESHSGKVPVFYHASDGKDLAPAVVGELVSKTGNGRTRKRRKTGAVNLIGYPGGRALRELGALLKDAGVEVSACLLPNLAPKDVARARAASLQIVQTDELYEGIIPELLKTFDAPVVRPPSPFGLEGTALWLEHAAKAAGSKGWKAAWTRKLRNFKKKWDGLVEEARRFRLGFVVDPSELSLLSESSRNAGVSLAPVLKEMGFSIDYFIYSPGESPQIAKGRRHVVRWFRDQEELTKLLADGGCAAVYTDVFFDRRLSRAGKAQFSLTFFEAGADGAVRSLERLLGVCRLPFYEKYGKYLGGRQ